MAVRRPIANYRDYPPEFQPYDTQYKGAKEAVGWMLWDTVPYVSAASVNLNFFNVARATVDLSNMEIPSQLAAPKAFFLRAIRFYVKNVPWAAAVAVAAAQTGQASDIQLLINTGVFQLTIGNKLYVQLPLWTLLSGGGVAGSAASGGAGFYDVASLGMPDNRAPYTLAKPLFIAPQINFIGNIIWPAAVVLVQGDTDITVALDGDLIRPVQ